MTSKNFDIDLLDCTEQGGCSAKISPQQLEELVKNLPFVKDPNLLVGAETHDDAAVWKINEETAIIQTTDFFPPLCSHPYDFGQIAATNALSDVYAMGGEAILALNLVMFPSAKMPLEILQEILRGGADKLKEANVVMAGGHTIDDDIPKYGLAVTGIVHPQKVITNAAARPGDQLILTKPLGTGVMIAGKKIQEIKECDICYQDALKSMKLLNRVGAELMQKFHIRCATDITGFGLLGHALRMAQASDVCFKISSDALPLFNNAYQLVEKGCIPGGAFRNLKFVEKMTKGLSAIDYNLKMLMLDPQTSGGLLICTPPEKAVKLLDELRKNGYPLAQKIGEVIPCAGGIRLSID
ncbi:MAG: selenide, water dikinase SelD [Pseudomonadota bacterium]